MKFVVASVNSIIIYFGDSIGEDVAKDVRSAFHALKEAKFSSIIEIIPSYTSLLVSYDFLNFSYDEICSEIKDIINSSEKREEEATRAMSIPVYYDASVGLDLVSLAEGKELSVEDVIGLHVEKDYFVYAIGFAPGFPYMGEVDKKIATPRLANPRAKVPKGSVGIADIQTAVYPKESPGGWQIIGRTPTELFDASYEGLSYLRVGDKVNFEPISKEMFKKLGGVL